MFWLNQSAFQSYHGRKSGRIDDRTKTGNLQFQEEKPGIVILIVILSYRQNHYEKVILQTSFCQNAIKAIHVIN